MAREKKDGQRVSLLMDREVAERLDQFCKDSGLSKTTAIEHALRGFMDDYYERVAKKTETSK